MFFFGAYQTHLITIKPSGVFIDRAQELVPKPILTEDDLMLRFQFAVNDALANGLTSIHDAGFDPTSLSFFKRYLPYFMSHLSLIK